MQIFVSVIRGVIRGCFISLFFSLNAWALMPTVPSVFQGPCNGPYTEVLSNADDTAILLMGSIDDERILYFFEQLPDSVHTVSLESVGGKADIAMKIELSFISIILNNYRAIYSLLRRATFCYQACIVIVGTYEICNFYFTVFFIKCLGVDADRFKCISRTL